MPWYRFDQNNSGGSFDIEPDKGVGAEVFIEAANPKEANLKAEELGLYFDGVDDGRDCDCCGDRWSRASKYDETEYPEYVVIFNWGPAFAHPIDGDFYELTPIPFK